MKNKTLSIKSQFYIISFIMIACIIFLCILANINSRNILLDTTVSYTENTFMKYENEMKFLYYQVSSLCENLQYDTAYSDILSKSSLQDVRADMVTNVIQRAAFIKNLNPSIVDIAFANDIVHYSSNYAVSDLGRLRGAAENQTGTVGLGLQHSSIRTRSDTDYFVFAYNLLYDYEQIGTVFLSVDLNRYLNIDPSDTDIPATILLMDQKQRMVPFNSGGDADTDTYINAASFTDGYDREKGGYQSQITDKHVVGISYSDGFQSYLISSVDIQSIGSRTSGIQFFIWLAVVAAVFFLFVISFIIFRNLVRPLGEFSHEIRMIRKNKQRSLEKQLRLSGCSEIVLLSTEFSDMLQTIHGLNEQIILTASDLYETELQKQTAEIAHLRSQINPHFLYNTLEMLQSMAYDKDAPEIASICTAMGKMFHYSTKGGDFVTLSEEMDITRAYLQIQQARFRKKFDVIFTVDPAITKHQVIKMLLQPIVENAVIYGMEAKSGIGTLMISAAQTPEHLTLTVRDDGPGIDEELLGKLQRAMLSNLFDTSRHVGLVNVDARVKLQYGKQYGVRLKSKKGDGTVVSILLPA